MKRILCVALLLTYAGAYEQTASELPPDFADFMTIKPIDDKYFTNNLFVSWMGLNYPRQNWATIYRDIFKQNDELLNKSMLKGRLAVKYMPDPMQNIFAFEDSSILPQNQMSGSIGKMVSFSSYLLRNEKLLRFQQIPFANDKYISSSNYFPCLEYRNLQCLSQMKERAAYIQEIINYNAELLLRFRKMVRESEYTYALFYNDSNTIESMLPSSCMGNVYQLNLADAMLDLVDENIDGGLDKLVLARQWIDLLHKEESESTLPHFLRSITFSQLLDQSINILLTDGILKQHMDDERLAFIVRPYPENIGQKLNRAILWEWQQTFKSYAYPYVKVYINAPDTSLLTKEDEYIILSYFKELSIQLAPTLSRLLVSLSRNVDSNQWSKLQALQQLKNTPEVLLPVYMREGLNNLHTTFLDENSSMSQEDIALVDRWYLDYFEDLGVTPEEAITILNTKYPSDDFYADAYEVLKTVYIKENQQMHLTEELLDSWFMDKIKFWPTIKDMVHLESFHDFWLRLYTQQNYHQLVYLKYLIMKDQIDARNVDEFLVSMGNLARNTVTNTPYKFNVQTRILSTPLPKEGKYLPISVRDARLDERVFDDFEVTIPIQ